MKIFDLSNDELNAWVARTMGWQLFYMEPGQLWYTLFEQPGGGEGPVGTIETGAVLFDDFSPSTCWGDGGRIIDEQKISLTYHRETGTWEAEHGTRQPLSKFGAEGYGNTALEAAMRCVVAHAYGESVPDEVRS